MYNIENILLFNKMAKEMSMNCNLLMKQLECELPEQMMDVLLKVRTRTGDHTFIPTHWSTEDGTMSLNLLDH